MYNVCKVATLNTVTGWKTVWLVIYHLFSCFDTHCQHWGYSHHFNSPSSSPFYFFFFNIPTFLLLQRSNSSFFFNRPILLFFWVSRIHSYILVGVPRYRLMPIFLKDVRSCGVIATYRFEIYNLEFWYIYIYIYT